MQLTLRSGFEDWWFIWPRSQEVGEEKKAIQGASVNGSYPCEHKRGPPRDGAESLRPIPTERREIWSISPVRGPNVCVLHKIHMLKALTPRVASGSKEVIKVKGHKGEALIL